MNKLNLGLLLVLIPGGLTIAVLFSIICLNIFKMIFQYNKLLGIMFVITILSMSSGLLILILSTFLPKEEQE